MERARETEVTDAEIIKFAARVSDVVRALRADGVAALPLEQCALLRACTDELDDAVENHELSHVAVPLLHDAQRRIRHDVVLDKIVSPPWHADVEAARRAIENRGRLQTRIAEAEVLRVELADEYRAAVGEDQRAQMRLLSTVPESERERVVRELLELAERVQS